ncbi:MAG: tetratricopeptide repeat protein [Bacteroidales bacterium]|nr:tetratricopeptide repeat protein [Bacteroidales bacterium]
MKKATVILFTVIYTFSYSQENNNIDSLKQSLINKNDTAYINTLIKIAEAYTSFQNDSAKKYSQSALKYSKKIKNNFFTAKSLYSLGYIYYFKENFSEAITLLDSSLNIFEEINDTLEIVKTTEKLGMIYFKQSNYPKAHECFTKELMLAEKIGYVEAQATSANNIAIIYSNEKEYENALEYYQNALHLYEKTGNKTGIAILQNNIGDIYKKQKKFEDAFNHYFKSLNNFEELKYESGTAYCKSNIGETYLLTGNTKEASLYLFAAEKIFIKSGDNFGLAEVYNNLGEIFEKMSDYDKSIIYFFKSIKHAKKVGSLDHIQDDFLKISELYEKRGIHKNALLYYKKYTELKDSIYNTENTRMINQLKINYETEKKDKKIRLNKVRISKQRNLLYILSGGFFIIFLFLIIIFIQKQKQNQAYKVLVHKNLALMETEQKLTDTMFEHEAIIDNISKTNETEQKLKSESSLITIEQRHTLSTGLLKLMEEDKIFLNNDITVNKIAEKLSTNKLYISNIINLTYKQNFNTFINVVSMSFS